MSNLELILIIYIVVSQIIGALTVYFIPKKTKLQKVFVVITALLFPTFIIFSLIDDLIRYIKRKKVEK